MLQPKGRAITIRKYGFLLPPVEEEERLCSRQPSAQGALISHLDVIYCGLHRENSVYCNRDHNYHRLALSQDQTRVVRVCVRTRTRLCAEKDICTSINGLMLRKWCLSKPRFRQTRTHLFYVAIFMWVLFQLKWFKQLCIQNVNNCTLKNNEYVPHCYCICLSLKELGRLVFEK